jgi:transposase-like protein
MAELRLEVVLEAERSGESVAEICRRYMFSRETYYPASASLPARSNRSDGWDTAFASHRASDRRSSC